MKIDHKLQLYFYDPYINEEEYSKTFRSLTGGDCVAYSPLYLLRRHILVLSGRLFEYSKLAEPIFHTPYFSAILLSNIMITGLASLVKLDGKQYPEFYLRYLGKNTTQLVGLRLLRNALEHNNFMLFTKIYKNNLHNTKEFYDHLVKYFISTGDIKNSDSEKIDYFKVAFDLTEDYSEIVSDPRIYLRLRDKYALIKYQIRPFKFLERLEKAIPEIKKDIQNNDELFGRFDTSVTADNWMHVYSQK